MLYFMDWCPVSHIHFRGNDLLKEEEQLSPDFYRHIVHNEKPVVLAVTYRRRRDGFFIFAIQFNDEIMPGKKLLPSYAVDWARNVSQIIKKSAFGHTHVYHDFSDRNSHTPVGLVPHNAVLIEDVSSDDFLNRLFEESNNLEIQKKAEVLRDLVREDPSRIASLLGKILAEDYFLFSIHAQHRAGIPSLRRACLVLEYHQSRKKEEYITQQQIQEQQSKDQRPIFVFFAAAIALVSCLLVLLWLHNMIGKLSGTQLMIAVLFSITLGFFVWSIIVSNYWYLPMKTKLESLKGYLSNCAICSAMICAISNNASQAMKNCRNGCIHGDPYCWTINSIEPILNQRLARYQAMNLQITFALAAIASFIGLIAIAT